MSPLARLAQAHGIALRYHDIWGTAHETSDDTLRALLAAMGVDASSDALAEAAMHAHRHAEWQTRVAPLVVVRANARQHRIRLNLPAIAAVTDVVVRIVTEAGDERERVTARTIDVAEDTIADERWQARDVLLDTDLPLGYHRVTFEADQCVLANTTLAVAPHACHRPSPLHKGGRTWGTAVQLYGLRSRRNWGIGDFGDLATVVTACGRHGAGVVGVNPLHALFPHNPRHASPYSPSSRLFLNTLYVDVEAIADYAECAPARALVASAAFRARLAALREAPLVDHAGVAQAKREVLDLVYASFRRNHLEARSERGEAFRRFQRDGGEALHRHALFEAIQAHFHAGDANVWGWPAWPEPFRDPRSPQVTRFAREHETRVDFHAWLQWQADLQRGAVATDATRAGLAIGLYADLAVSIDRGGAEAWAHQHLYAGAASVGAPPDAFNPSGQDWGLPPIVPARLREAGYAPFIATLRANMRHAGALRIDHVMGLMRLFWVPPGAKPVDGAYVHYPFDEMLALLALESRRHECLVIGEDLGTVPDEVRRALADHDILSYRVLLFERDEAGDFKPPGAYPEAAVATASTHDLPTLAGWWEGRDIDLRAGLGLMTPEERGRQLAERDADRVRLLRALASAGVLPDGASTDAADWPQMTPMLAEAIAAFLAATPAVLDIVQLEDVLLLREQANLPGTTDEHPNWRRKLPRGVEDMFDDDAFASLSARIRRQRPQ